MVSNSAAAAQDKTRSQTHPPTHTNSNSQTWPSLCNYHSLHTGGDEGGGHGRG